MAQQIPENMDEPPGLGAFLWHQQPEGPGEVLLPSGLAKWLPKCCHALGTYFWVVGAIMMVLPSVLPYLKFTAKDAPGDTLPRPPEVVTPVVPEVPQPVVADTSPPLGAGAAPAPAAPPAGPVVSPQAAAGDGGAAAPVMASPPQAPAPVAIEDAPAAPLTASGSGAANPAAPPPAPPLPASGASMGSVAGPAPPSPPPASESGTAAPMPAKEFGVALQPGTGVLKAPSLLPATPGPDKDGTPVVIARPGPVTETMPPSGGPGADAGSGGVAAPKPVEEPPPGPPASPVVPLSPLQELFSTSSYKDYTPAGLTHALYETQKTLHITADGVPGKGTRSTIVKRQQALQLPPTGLLDDETLHRMGVAQVKDDNPGWKVPPPPSRPTTPTKKATTDAPVGWRANKIKSLPPKLPIDESTPAYRWAKGIHEKFEKRSE